MVSLFLIIAIFFVTTAVFADDTTATQQTFRYTDNVTINLSSNYYSDNWDGEERSSLNWTASRRKNIERDFLRAGLMLEYNMFLSYGQNFYKDSTKWGDPEKATDVIDLEKILTYQNINIFEPYTSARVVTAFTDNHDSLDVTYYLNDIEITESIGGLKRFAPSETSALSFRAGLAVKQDVKRNVWDSQSRTWDSEFRHFAGAEFVTRFSASFKEDIIKYSTRLGVFKAVYNSEVDGLDAGNDDWKAVDVNWENTVSVSLTEFLMLNFYLQALYDKQIDSDVRIRNNSSIALTWNYKNF